MINIEIERYEAQKVEIYRTNGDFYGILNNEHEFNKFRIKMLLQNATTEFYFKWNDVKIIMGEDGNLSDFPVGMYDQARIDLLKICHIARERRKVKL